MKEINDREQLHHYLQSHQIESIFNEQIMPYLSLYRFEQGENICSQGEPAHDLYILVKGKVKIYTTSPEGKTFILSFRTPLEVIGDIEYIQGIDIINTVEAISAVEMIGIQQSILKKFVQDYAPFLQFILDIITKKFYLKSHAMSLNLLYPVDVRLASYLLSISYDENDDVVSGQHRSRLADTANLIGTSYRHLNRVIQQFCAKGLIERSNGFIHIKDREGLRALVSRNIYE
ncbi:Crp/Fnr family transcriptional regulator [Neobacillus jeddahensis]|uniref:Crp/Fnr family transcriptional regulator n=1 Tax=Neobacillus jeddahensis TaxID=1461580 RepID=UPI00058E2434|nr:cyclic nucleotide-binding domain-containing protein [Neobacillus jeddahensis]